MEKSSESRKITDSPQKIPKKEVTTDTRKQSADKIPTIEEKQIIDNAKKCDKDEPKLLGEISLPPPPEGKSRRRSSPRPSIAAPDLSSKADAVIRPPSSNKPNQEETVSKSQAQAQSPKKEKEQKRSVKVKAPAPASTPVSAPTSAPLLNKPIEQENIARKSVDRAPLPNKPREQEKTQYSADLDTISKGKSKISGKMIGGWI